MNTWEVKELAVRWFHNLDVHSDLEQVQGMLSTDSLYMRFPESEIRTIDGFKEWYHNVLHLFFDESHLIQSMDVSIKGNEAIVKVIVNWKVKTWTPPSARSDSIDAVAFQTWKIVESESGLVITEYIVDSIVYA